jgi:DNA repair exonuclease SbcCD ATPase subunit
MKNYRKTLHERFSNYGANAKLWMLKCELLLPEIEKNKVWEEEGFGSIYEYAAKLAGMSREKVRDSLRILRKIEDKPELMKVAREKGVRAVRPVATIAKKEDEEFWAEKADSLSVNTLETFVREVRYEKSGHMTTLISEKEHIEMDLEPEIAESLKKLKGKGDWNDLIKQFLETREKQLEKEKPETKKTASRHIPAKISRYSRAKTNGTCCFPRCLKKAEALHHTDRFSLSKEHDPDRIKPLCKAHHDLAHRGLIKNENLPPRYWEIRKTPDETSAKFIIDQRVIHYKNQKFA